MFYTSSHPVRTALGGAVAVILGFGLSGCGSDSTTASQATVSGSAIAGAVTGNLVVSDADGNEVVSGSVTDGSFSVSLSSAALADALTFSVTGSYVDEVSGNTVTLGANNPLALTLAANHFTAGQAGNAPVTPDSTVIHHLVRNHNMSMTQAQTAFQNAFGYLPDMDAVPFDPSETDSTTAAGRPQADRDAAFRAGMFSQLASDLGLSGDDIAAMLGALADDLADNSLDGMGSTGSSVTIGTAAVNLQTLHQSNPISARLLSAHGAFAGNSNNSAGLPAPSMGLPSISYDEPGASKTVTTASGRNITVTLDTAANTPIAAGYWTSRVKHHITLIDADTLSPIDMSSDPDIKGLSHHPYMHMLSGHDHTTPHGHAADMSQAAQGIYTLDAYYVMASEMGMGESAMPMGVWDYSINIKEDTTGDSQVDSTTPVMFHPQVKMPMAGNVFIAKVSNSNHQWTNMMGMSLPRDYRVWLHEVSANSNSSHDLTVFVSTTDMGNMDMSSMSGSHSMMTFPAAYTGQSLHGPVNDMGMRPDVSLASVTVEVSLDDGTTWQGMTETVDTGLFSIAELVGLDTSAQDTLSFRVSINDGTADYVMTTAAGGHAELVFTAP